MDAEKFFKEMFHCIWQSQDLSRFDDFYSEDFTESISVSDEKNQPLELRMNYEDLLQEAKRQKEEFRNVTLDIKKIVHGEDNHLSVNFYSSSIDNKTEEKRHRWVCGIWHLNQENKIDRVWAVVTPYYAS
ncbi:MAG: hypothetical protein K1000chlam3_00538 [Chlamydiae bacterium]|nr:hypothetical protein [Chlamydiota bacterium]